MIDDYWVATHMGYPDWWPVEMTEDFEDPPVRSLWTVVGWATGAGVCTLVAVYLIRKLDKGIRR